MSQESACRVFAVAASATMRAPCVVGALVGCSSWICLRQPLGSCQLEIVFKVVLEFVLLGLRGEVRGQLGRSRTRGEDTALLVGNFFELPSVSGGPRQTMHLGVDSEIVLPVVNRRLVEPEALFSDCPVNRATRSSGLAERTRLKSSIAKP